MRKAGRNGFVWNADLDEHRNGMCRVMWSRNTWDCQFSALFVLRHILEGTSLKLILKASMVLVET